MKLFAYKNEEARLNEVTIYKNLQALCTAQLQDLVNIASSYFSAPMVCISLIDNLNQVLIAKKGITLDEMRKEDTFCHHIINKGTPLIINDPTKDRIFKSNPLVKYYPHIRFYAGAPFISKNGFVLGAFCICDTKFRVFSGKDKQRLVAFSKLATEIIETNLLAEKLQKPVTGFRDAEDEFTYWLKNQLRNLNNWHCRKRTNEAPIEAPINMQTKCKEQTGQTPAFKSNNTVLDSQDTTALAAPPKSKMYQWGEMMLASHRRKISAINFSTLAKGISVAIEAELKSKGNRVKWNIKESVDWGGDEIALTYLCNSLLQNINCRNKNSTIRISTFNDEDYAIMTIRHEGAPLVRSELDDAFKSSPYMIDSKNKEDLYFIWHTLKLMSGFITVPSSTKEENYITVGFPKKQMHKTYPREETYC